MHLEIVKTDFLTLDGKINSFALTPKTNLEGLRKVRIDRAMNFDRTREHRGRTLGGNIIYNYRDCNLEITTTPPNNNFHYNSEEKSFSFEYDHMNIPLGLIGEGNIGRWNLILPPEWRLTELYLSDPYHKAEKVEDKKQFQYTLHWDTASHTQLVEMELRSKRGSFSFIIKGKAYNIFENPTKDSLNFISCLQSDIGIADLNSLKFGFSNKNILEVIYNSIEFKPNFYGIGYDFKKTIQYFFSSKKDSN